MEETSNRSLPLELVEEILKRTPVESLSRFKSTCKEWYDLITDKRFMYNHLDRSPERFIIRIFDDRTVQIMDPVTGNISYSPISDMFDDPYSSASMVHCDGLMLCMCYDDSFCRQTRGATLAVWNPVTRKIKWIEPLVCYSETDYFGMGYDNTCRHNYKILRSSGPPSLGDPEEYEIYEFRSDSWRSLDAKVDLDEDTDCRGVSVKGNVYWIAKRTEKEEFIVLISPWKRSRTYAFFLVVNIDWTDGVILEARAVKWSVHGPFGRVHLDIFLHGPNLDSPKWRMVHKVSMPIKTISKWS
ncbi:PREDICTED: putative F-box only protein 15 [Camelina sativa]|uniref:F-box only protein 15 n=1 Tax=Camelina sativa TaxID=90675 RepID=A0ABM0VIX2_CAMSA|nr:PREDICTED: putative F-box only protein 15 [Camelina sativa]